LVAKYARINAQNPFIVHLNTIIVFELRLKQILILVFEYSLGNNLDYLQQLNCAKIIISSIYLHWLLTTTLCIAVTMICLKIDRNVIFHS